MYIYIYIYIQLYIYIYNFFNKHEIVHLLETAVFRYYLIQLCYLSRRICKFQDRVELHRTIPYHLIARLL